MSNAYAEALGLIETPEDGEAPESRYDPEETYVVPLSQLRVDRKITCRAKVDGAFVSTIARGLLANAGCDALTVADLDGTLTLLDGLHRYHAMREAGREDAPVRVLPHVTTVEEARWQASSLNWRPSKPLTIPERREAFRRYVQADRHRKGEKLRGNIKSYREMQEDLPGAVRGTLHNWMQKDFPSVAAAMAGAEEKPEAGGCRDFKMERVERRIAHHLDQIALLTRPPHGGLEAAREALQAALDSLDGGGPSEGLVNAPAGYDFS